MLQMLQNIYNFSIRKSLRSIGKGVRKTVGFLKGRVRETVGFPNVGSPTIRSFAIARSAYHK